MPGFCPQWEELGLVSSDLILASLETWLVVLITSGWDTFPDTLEKVLGCRTTGLIPKRANRPGFMLKSIPLPSSFSCMPCGRTSPACTCLPSCYLESYNHDNEAFCECRLLWEWIRGEKTHSHYAHYLPIIIPTEHYF